MRDRKSYIKLKFPMADIFISNLQCINKSQRILNNKNFLPIWAIWLKHFALSALKLVFLFYKNIHIYSNYET